MGQRSMRWKARPWTSHVLRLVLVLVPVAAGTMAGALLAQAIPAPTGFVDRLLWSVLVIGASTLVLLAVDRGLRRLAPLTLLLRLGLAFPDEAPRRFRVAMRAIRPSRRADGSPDAATSLSLLAALLTHDRRTRGHSERVAAYATMIADELGLPHDERDRLTWGALLHDIGKLEVPGRILNKPGTLDEAEWEIMTGHPAAGGALVEPLRHWLGEALTAVDGHHERYDGRGYPASRPAAELPDAARITAVADAFETMTAARSYKEPMSIGAARAEVAACSGSHFDPEVCRAFLALSVPRLWRVAGPLSWLAQVPVLGLVARGDVVPVALSSAAQSAAGAAGQAAVAAAVVGGALAASGVTGPVDDLPRAQVAVRHEDEAASTSGSTSGTGTASSAAAAEGGLPTDGWAHRRPATGTTGPRGGGAGEGHERGQGHQGRDDGRRPGVDHGQGDDHGQGVDHGQGHGPGGAPVTPPPGPPATPPAAPPATPPATPPAAPPATRPPAPAPPRPVEPPVGPPSGTPGAGHGQGGGQGHGHP